MKTRLFFYSRLSLRERSEKTELSRSESRLFDRLETEPITWHRLPACVLKFSAMIAMIANTAVGQDDLFQQPRYDRTTSSFSSSSSRGDNTWERREGNSLPLAGGMQPEWDELIDLRVDWLPIELDSLGEIATLRGRLMMVTGDSDDVVVPITWQQAITIAMAREPAGNSDHDSDSEPLNLKSNVALTKCCVTNEKGEFVEQIELSELRGDRHIQRAFRVSTGLGTHEDRSDLKLGPLIKWSSKDLILEGSRSVIQMPAKPALDAIIDVLQTACKDGQGFDSLAILRAVNALHALGKDRALQKMEAFVKLRGYGGFRDGTDNLFWILRILFEPIELGAKIPVPMAFVNSVRDANEGDWPLNPIVVVKDIPFRFIGGGIGGSGHPEHPESHIEYVRRHCVMRDRPLSPQGDPIAVAQELLQSHLIRGLGGAAEYGERDVKQQAITLLPKSSLQAQDEEPESIAVWSDLVERSVLRPHLWNDALQCFRAK